MRKIKFFVRGLISLYDLYIRPLDKTIYGFCGKGVILQPPLRVCNPKNVFLEDDVNIFGTSNLIVSVSGKFIMKKKSGAAQGLTVVTANHPTNPDIGKWHKEVYKDTSTDVGSHVIIEEDVWIASNVTLLPNVVVGRGAIVGAGSVCRKSVPPYSIVMGNPAKVVGFKYTVDEILEHEAELYPIQERLSRQVLEKNYNKYYSNRIKEIAHFVK